MLLDVGTDQRFFQETTARFLDERVPVSELRRLRDVPAGFEPEYWQQGAQLGWTSLLVDEARGGGSLSDHGVLDLALVAYEFGRHGAPGPLLTTNVVAAAVAEAGGPGTGPLAGLLDDLLTGSAVAGWCPPVPLPGTGPAGATRPAGARPTGTAVAGAHPTGTAADDGRAGPDTLQVRVEGPEVVVDGLARHVESGAEAAAVLVTGHTGQGLTQVLVPAGTAGTTVTAMRSVDLTRRFTTVRLRDVRLPLDHVVGEVGGAAAQVAQQHRLAVAVSTAEAVGAMQSGFDMTVEWAFDRYSFGRPLASYQAIKHRFADMKTWLEASHAISDAALGALAAGAPDADELLSAAKAYVGDFGTALLQDCVQLHGGIGVTFDHDLHVHLRRHTLDRALYGTPSEHRRRLADLAEASADPGAPA